MALYEDAQGLITLVIDTYKKSVTTDGLSFKDAVTLVYNATATFVRLIENFTANGEIKKETVKLAVTQFYDQVIAPVDIKGVPNLMEGMVDNAIKYTILMFIDMWIDSLVNIFNKLGWGNEKVENTENLTQPLIF